MTVWTLYSTSTVQYLYTVQLSCNHVILHLQYRSVDREVVVLEVPRDQLWSVTRDAPLGGIDVPNRSRVATTEDLVELPLEAHESLPLDGRDFEPQLVDLPVANIGFLCARVHEQTVAAEQRHPRRSEWAPVELYCDFSFDSEEDNLVSCSGTLSDSQPYLASRWRQTHVEPIVFAHCVSDAWNHRKWVAVHRQHLQTFRLEFSTENEAPVAQCAQDVAARAHHRSQVEEAALVPLGVGVVCARERANSVHCVYHFRAPRAREECVGVRAVCHALHALHPEALIHVGRSECASAQIEGAHHIVRRVREKNLVRWFTCRHSSEVGSLFGWTLEFVV